MRHLYRILFLVASVTPVAAQQVESFVTGIVVDRSTGAPLDDVNIRLEGGPADISTQTKGGGKFSLSVPVHRYKITASSTGFTTNTQEILTSAGKTLIVNFTLSPAVQELKEVEVTSSSINDDLAGQRSLTIEKTLRIPANYLDPVRAFTAYPGVVVVNDQANAIIVRGNSPNGLSWKLNGADIVNPNHLSNAGTFSDKPMANGGGVNIISSQIIDKTNFYTGQVPIPYGNSLSGIIDMSLREGNKDKMEYTAQASLIGLDVAAEGPLGKSKNTSFLANYRYSTVGLLSGLGVDFGDESITFQDFSFHLNHRSAKGVVLSVFGFWGASKNDFDAKPMEDWEEEKDQYTINYKSGTGAVGLNFLVPLQSGKFSGSVAYSATSQSRNAAFSPDVFVSALHVRQDDYDQSNNLLSTRLDYSLPLSNSITWQVGVNANVVDNSIDAYKFSVFGNADLGIERKLAGDNDGTLVQPYTSFVATLSPKMTLDAGIRYVSYTFNDSDAIEPRASLSYKGNDGSSLAASYGIVSQMQMPQLYALNKNLELTKSHHMDLAYTKMFANDVQLRTGLYYQRLVDVPISNTSLFSALNFLEGLPDNDLVSKGTGDNYGVDATVEKQFFNNHYVLVGASYYESTYVASDGVERNTRFNGNYTLSAIHGKEWTKESKRRTIGLNTRVLYLGGLRDNAVLETPSSLSGETVYDGSDPFSEKLQDYFRLDIRLSFRKNKPGYTRTFAIDIQNLTNQQNEAYRYYDHVQNKVVTKYHLGIIPLLVYRIDF